MSHDNQHDHRPVEAPRVSLEEAGRLAQQGQALLVDVRTPEEYRFSHAPGAVNVPLRGLPDRLEALPLPEERQIITICT